MSLYEEKIKSLGLVLPATPIPQGSYIPAVRSGNLIFISGQLPMRSGELIYKGKVGLDLDIVQAQEAAKLCFLNILAALKSTAVELDQIKRILRLGGFVQSAEGFFDQPKVLNGASDLSRNIFGEVGQHARAAIGVSSLPLNAAVEIEALIEVQG